MCVLTIALSVAEAVVLSCCTLLSRSQKTEEESRELPTKVGSGLVEKFHLQRNRRATTTLSPILYPFQLPTSTLSQKLKKVLSEVAILPVVETQRRAGPRDIPYGIPEQEWPVVLARVANHESYRQVAKDYGVSRETIRRLVQASQKAG
jgi:hypothetical protein